GGGETPGGLGAGEWRGLPIQKVRVQLPDTDVTPYDTISAGSRSTYHMGNAIRGAAAQIREQLFETAASALDANPEDLVLREERIFVPGAEERGLTIPEGFRQKLGAMGTTLVRQSTYALTA